MKVMKRNTAVKTQNLRHQNSSLLEENASKNKIIKILSENLRITNKNMCDTNSKPEEKLRTETSCENRYETLYLTDSDDANVTEDTGNTSSIDDECCFDQRKE